MIWHNTSTDEVLRELNTDIARGLSSEQAAERVHLYGKNKFYNKQRKSWYKYILNEFLTFFNIALIITAIIFGVLSLVTQTGNFAGPLVIIAVIIIVSVVRGYSKYDADLELDKLRNNVKTYITVIRDGSEVSISSELIVPGDIMVLKSGDYIRADGRLIDSYALTLDEYRITGETAPNEKNHLELYDDITPITHRKNMVYSGSVVQGGRGLAVVTETGRTTEIGKVEDISLQIEVEQTPLKAKIVKTELITFKTILICALILFAVGMIVDFSSTKVSFAVTVSGHLLSALAVFSATYTCGISSFLSLATTAAVRRLKKKDITVGHPETIEKLKEISVICTDKTGSLTSEELIVVKLCTASGIVTPEKEPCDDQAIALLRLALICSNFSHGEHMQRHSNNMERAIEAACISYAGMNKADIDGLYPKIGEIPFTSERMLMTTVTVINGNPVAIIKGAPEVIASRCTDAGEGVLSAAQNFAKEGLKVLAVAIKPLAEIPANLSSDLLETELNFVGILGFEDAVDPEAAALCKECINSDIKIVMITGDHIDTATAVALKLGIINDASAAISGEGLAELSDHEFNEKVVDYRIFARISPEDKLRIVNAFRAAGEKVLVTGDSVNDTQTILGADIGCALGKTASDIAKDSADLVVNDNKFSSVIAAFKESVRIFIDIKKALGYVLTAILTFLTVTIFGLVIFGKSPLSAACIMVCGLLSLTVPLFAIFFDGSETSSAFKVKDIKIFNKEFIYSFVVPTIFISVMALVSFGVTNGARSAVFATLLIAHIIHAFCLTYTDPIGLKNTVTSIIAPALCCASILPVVLTVITPVGALFMLDRITASGWIIALIAAVGTVLIDEGIKLIQKLKTR